MKKKEHLVAALLVITTLAGIGFAVVYSMGAQTQLSAALLASAFGTLAAAMVVYEHELMPHPPAIEQRGSLPSGEPRNAAAADALLDGVQAIAGTRAWLLRIFAGAVATLGVAALFPLRSLAPRGAGPVNLGSTSWRKGLRLVREDGTLVRADDLAVNSMVTVFPEGYVGPHFVDEMTNDATVLLRVPPSELRLPNDRTAWAPNGLLAFSKICTHAGCPVGLYRAAARQLYCPCHQSTFDVLTGGRRIFGPAARGLPQLPIAVAADGNIEALGGYPEPIGPGYWERA